MHCTSSQVRMPKIWRRTREQIAKYRHTQVKKSTSMRPAIAGLSMEDVISMETLHAPTTYQANLVILITLHSKWNPHDLNNFRTKIGYISKSSFFTPLIPTSIKFKKYIDLGWHKGKISALFHSWSRQKHKPESIQKFVNNTWGQTRWRWGKFPHNSHRLHQEDGSRKK